MSDMYEAELSYASSSSFLNKKPRTQKGVGLETLRTYWSYSSAILSVQGYLQDEEQAQLVKFPCFARPCPSRPRHGYIDSRVVKDVDTLKALLKEVLADDPKGEVMIAPFIKATTNAIWTPSLLVMGRGNDGATCGKNTISFPLTGKMPSELSAELLKQARVGGEEWPYIEVVWGADKRPIITQLRAGPKVAGIGGDYIPHDVEVKSVVVAEGELTDWEKLMDKLDPEDGVVIHHPGGAIADHYSIHAFCHHIPILFGPEAPKVGDTLKANTKKATFDPTAMLRGVIAGERVALKINGSYSYEHNQHTNVAAATEAVLVALHNSTALTGNGSFWLGVAASLMIRLGMTALKGEARHFSNPKGWSREQVYKLALPHLLSRHRAQVNRLINIFRYGDFGGGGVGGPKWAQCGVAIVGLFNAIRDLAQDPGTGTASAVVKALNVAVNQAHNGGWWLNKFCGGTAFHLAQNGNIATVLNTVPLWVEAADIMDGMSEAAEKKALSALAAWPETTLRPPKVSQVELTYQPGIDAIGMKIRTRLLGPKSRIILAPVENIISTMDKFVGDCTYLTETKNGFKVEIRHPEKGTFTLWEDQPMKPQEVKSGGAEPGE